MLTSTPRAQGLAHEVAAQGLYVQTLDGFEHLEMYEEDVRLLRSPSPHQRLEWLRAWWETYGVGSHRRLLLIAVFAGCGDWPQELVGLAPCYVQNEGGGVAVRLIGDGAVCSDHATMLCRPGHEEAAADAVADWLLSARAPAWTRLHWESVDECEVPLRRIAAHVADSGMLHMVRREPGSCVVDLPGDWETYLGSLSKNHRKRCRRWERAYFDDGQVRVEIANVADGERCALDRLIALHGQRRERLGDAGSFTDTEFVRFHRAAFQDMAAAGTAYCRFLVRDDQDLAAEYVLDDGQAFYAYQSGLSAAGEEISAGSLSLLALIRDAIAMGRRRVDLLRGVEPYKFHWNARHVPAETLVVRRPTLGGRLLHGYDALRGAASTWKARYRELTC